MYLYLVIDRYSPFLRIRGIFHKEKDAIKFMKGKDNFKLYKHKIING